jgi:osmotically inducible lipoprotein OsmB
MVAPKFVAIAVLLGVVLGGCDHMSRMQQRALSGGAIGAAGGAALTAVAGGPILAGTAIGAAGGAAIGALTAAGHR